MLKQLPGYEVSGAFTGLRKKTIASNPEVPVSFLMIQPDTILSVTRRNIKPAADLECVPMILNAGLIPAVMICEDPSLRTEVKPILFR